MCSGFEHTLCCTARMAGPARKGDMLSGCLPPAASPRPPVEGPAVEHHLAGQHGVGAQAPLGNLQPVLQAQQPPCV
jgi:hypothetical protein